MDYHGLRTKTMRLPNADCGMGAHLNSERGTGGGPFECGWWIAECGIGERTGTAHLNAEVGTRNSEVGKGKAGGTDEPAAGRRCHSGDGPRKCGVRIEDCGFGGRLGGSLAPPGSGLLWRFGGAAALNLRLLDGKAGTSADWGLRNAARYRKRDATRGATPWLVTVSSRFFPAQACRPG